MKMSLTQSVFPSSVIKTRDVSGFQMMEGLYYIEQPFARANFDPSEGLLPQRSAARLGLTQFFV